MAREMTIPVLKSSQKSSGCHRKAKYQKQNDMKTHSQSGLAALVASLVPAYGALAGDSRWQAIDHHHGTSTYLARAAQSEPTIAFTGHPKGTGSTPATVRRTSASPSALKFSLHVVATPHGAVSYVVPVE